MEGFNTAVLSDHDLLYGGVMDLVTENRANARRWARLVELYRRHPDTDGNFAMSSAQWTALETSEVWAMGDHLPKVWELCLAGSLDRFRAMTIADILRHRLDGPADWAKVAPKVVGFLIKHLSRYAEFNISMVTCTITQLRNKLNYETRKLAPADEEFARQFADRGVHASEFEDGMGALSITTSVDQVKLAKQRLWLSAKARRDQGDERTVRQLMSDLALDLIIGRADDLPVPNYARPIINVPVPLETLAGLRDDPGQLSGGTVIPADLARAIAQQEGATWYRLLTDADDEPVSLSTKSYAATGPIWRYLVATRTTCTHSACDRPSAECELDHREPYPVGPTDTVNLDPLCRRHHRAKHARAVHAA